MASLGPALAQHLHQLTDLGLISKASNLELPVQQIVPRLAGCTGLRSLSLELQQATTAGLLLDITPLTQLTSLALSTPRSGSMPQPIVLLGLESAASLQQLQARGTAAMLTVCHPLVRCAKQLTGLQTLELSVDKLFRVDAEFHGIDGGVDALLESFRSLPALVDLDTSGLYLKMSQILQRGLGPQQLCQLTKLQVCACVSWEQPDISGVLTALQDHQQRKHQQQQQHGRFSEQQKPTLSQLVGDQHPSSASQPTVLLPELQIVGFDCELDVGQLKFVMDHAPKLAKVHCNVIRYPTHTSFDDVRAVSQRLADMALKTPLPVYAMHAISMMTDMLPKPVEWHVQLLTCLRPLSIIKEFQLETGFRQPLSKQEARVIGKTLPSLKAFMGQLESCNHLLPWLSQLKTLAIAMPKDSSFRALEMLRLTSLDLHLPGPSMHLPPWMHGAQQPGLAGLRDLTLSLPYPVGIDLQDLHYLLHSAANLKLLRVDIPVSGRRADTGVLGINVPMSDGCTQETVRQLREVMVRLGQVGGAFCLKQGAQMVMHARDMLCPAGLDLIFEQDASSAMPQQTFNPNDQAGLAQVLCLSALDGKWTPSPLTLSQLHSFTPAIAQAVATALPNLTQLAIISSRVIPSAFAKLVAMQRLETLYILNCSGLATAEVMMAQGSMPWVRLVVGGCHWWSAQDSRALALAVQLLHAS